MSLHAIESLLKPALACKVLGADLNLLKPGLACELLGADFLLMIDAVLLSLDPAMTELALQQVRPSDVVLRGDWQRNAFALRLRWRARQRADQSFLR